MQGDNSNYNHHPHQEDAYKECLRNHAASLGSYATDGCGEFTVDENTPESGSLNCAACGCHRNFHRKVVLSQSRAHHHITMTAPAINGGTDYNNNRSSSSPMQMVCSPFEIIRSGNNNKKRFRTKFSDDQKEKMMRFAEKLGWRMMRKDEEDEIERFCRGIGISRKVFKVWMHNHKSNNSSNNSNNMINDDSSNDVSNNNNNNSAASHGNASSLTDDVHQ